MTVQLLLDWNDKQRVLDYLNQSNSDRKRRLCAAGSSRRYWHCLVDQRSQLAVSVGEQFADGQVSDEERQQVRAVAEEVKNGLVEGQEFERAAYALLARNAVDRPLLLYSTLLDTTVVRHIIGNPFRPYPAPPSWPSHVVQLATALYEGQDCSFALHDALLEAGHADLAEHFKSEACHPKGCWVLDVILGKE